MRKKDKPYFDALEDWQLMGLCIEREASGEPYEGRVAVGTVIMERVTHRKWDGDTIHEVILIPWQFSWTMSEAGLDYYNKSVIIAMDWDSYYQNKKDLADCANIAKGMLAGITPKDAELAKWHCCQYLNPNASIQSAATKAKWLKSGMKLIKTIAHHQFFKEA